MNLPDRAPASRPHGTRVRGTRQAEAVAAVLDRLPGFCSAQQIHAELREHGEQVGLTTVYRHLQVLSETGRIDAIRDSTGETLYRRCQTDAHHHHLTCRRCGRSVEVEGKAVDRWADEVAQQAGFCVVGHTVELVGDGRMMPVDRSQLPGLSMPEDWMRDVALLQQFHFLAGQFKLLGCQGVREVSLQRRADDRRGHARPL